MKKSCHSPLPTLPQQIRSQLLWLGTLLFIACVVLLVVFSWRSIDLLTDQLANLQADTFIRNLKDNPGYSLPKDRQNSVYRHWQDIPESLRAQFNYNKLHPKKSAESVVHLANEQLGYAYLLLRRDDDLGDLFFISQYSEDEIDQLVAGFFSTALTDAIWVTLIIFILLFFMIHWLFKKTSEPLAQLSLWADNLKPGSSSIDESAFSIQEINHIAHQLYDNINRIESFNIREQSFLKYASHEFRTPLAIIQASLDTLSITDINNRPVQRALRATANMNRLATSLLWIARESNHSITKQATNFQRLISDIQRDIGYLITNKPVVVETDITASYILIEKELVTIVLTNLIKNSFEHCSEGKVNIVVDSHYFEISNSYDSAESDTGFGLGLALTERICAKFGWQFTFSRTNHIATAQVKWIQLTAD